MEEVLKRYYKGETTLAEERELRSAWQRGELPGEPILGLRDPMEIPEGREEKLQRKNAKKAQREKVRKEKEEERRTKREARKAEREAARHKSEQEKPAEKIIGWWEKIRHKNEKKTESEVKEQMTENIAKDKNESAE